MLYCEQCGETEQEYHLTTVGVCETCYGKTLAEELEPTLGYKPCGQLCLLGDLRVICLEPYGVEHYHN